MMPDPPDPLTRQIRLSGDRRVDATFERPGAVAIMHLMATMPDMTVEPEAWFDGPHFEWVLRLVYVCSDMSREQVREIQARELGRACRCATYTMTGEDAPPKRGGNRFRVDSDSESEAASPFEGLDLNDDGTVNVEEFR